MTVKKALWQCTSFADQIEWCKEKLESGATLTEPYLFLAGTEPEKLIRALQEARVSIETYSVALTDAAGRIHPNTLAWRIQRFA